jgi:hypothetical protein
VQTLNEMKHKQYHTVGAVLKYHTTTDDAIIQSNSPLGLGKTECTLRFYYYHWVDCSAVELLVTEGIIFVFITPKTFNKSIWLSNLSVLNLPGEGYFRNV